MSQQQSTPIGVAMNRVGVPLDVPVWIESLERLKKNVRGKPQEEQRLAERQYEFWPHLADADGRIRFHMSTGWTGRMSTTKPCIHGIHKVMRAGIAAPGKLILTADWRASHPRILAVRSGDAHLRADLLEGDPYLALAKLIIENPNAEHRKGLKNAVNTRLNGGGLAKIGEGLRNAGIEVPPAELVGKMEARWKTAFRHLAEVRKKAVQDGWKIDIGEGVIIEVPGDKRSEHRVIAAYLQGIEAHALRRVILATRKVEERVGARLLFTAHDEAIWEVEPDKVDTTAKLISGLMGRALLGRDELATDAVEVQVGPNWAEQGPVSEDLPEPPESKERSRAGWIELGVTLMSEVARSDDPKAKIADILGVVENRHAIEMAALHKPEDFKVRVAEIEAVSGGREPAKLFRATANRARKAIGPFVKRIEKGRADKSNTDGTDPLQLERGDHVELADAVFRQLGGVHSDGGSADTIIGDLGCLWTCRDGLWAEIRGGDVRVQVQQLAGTPIGDGEKSHPLRVSSNDCFGVERILGDRLSVPGFFDTDRAGAPMANGLVGLDGVLRPFEGTDRVRTCEVSPVGFDPAATCPAWMNFLSEITDGEDSDEKQAVLAEWTGAALLGVATRFATALVLVGSGANGKSTALNVISGLFPAMSVGCVPPHQLAGSKAEYYAARLAGLRVNVVTEMSETEVISTESIKAIISGDPVTGRHPAGRPFEFCPQAAWVIAANALPPVRDVSDGFWRRMLVLPFERQFKGTNANPNLVDELVAELPGIAVWAIEGGRRLLRQGRYTTISSAVRAVETWRTESNSVSTFITAHTEPESGEKYRASLLYKLYRQWCQDHGHRAVSSTKFGKVAGRLRSRGGDALGRFYSIRIARDWRRVNVDDLTDLSRDLAEEARVRRILAAIKATHAASDSEVARAGLGLVIQEMATAIDVNDFATAVEALHTAGLGDFEPSGVH